MAKNVQMKDVGIHYRKFHAVQSVHLSVPSRAVAALICPYGMRQIHGAADDQPDARSHPQGRGRGPGNPSFRANVVIGVVIGLAPDPIATLAIEDYSRLGRFG